MANLKDALKKAMKDPKFARQLVSSPDEFQDRYNLNAKQVKTLKTIGSAATKAAIGLKTPGVGPAAEYD